MKKIKGSLYLFWILASASGMAAGLLFALLLFLIITSLFPTATDRIMTFIALPAIGLLTGLVQFFVLKWQKINLQGWIIVCLTGGSLCIPLLLLFEKISFHLPGLWKDAIMLLLFGVVIGALQMIVLHHQYHRSIWWLLASSIGFLFPLLMIANPSSTLAGFVGLTALAGAFWGLITGLLLVNLVPARK